MPAIGVNSNTICDMRLRVARQVRLGKGGKEKTTGASGINGLIKLANGFCDRHLSGHERSEEVEDGVFLCDVSAQAGLYRYCMPSVMY
jgi:hypothetical protein